MYRVNKLLFGGLAFLAFFTCSCEDDRLLDNNHQSQISMDYQYDMDMIFHTLRLDTIDVKDYGNYYIVEGDIIVNKNSLRNNVMRGYRTTTFTPRNIEITIGVDGTSIPSTSPWVSALQEVIGIYNSYSSLSLSYVSSGTPMILVRKDNLSGTDVCALGEFPVEGIACQYGDEIIINNAFIYNIDNFLSHSQKVFLLMHELGHNLGLRHSDCMSNGEGSSTIGAILIPNTPANDTGSFMRSSSCGASWTEMSYYDKEMLKFLWPKSYIVSFMNCNLSPMEFFYSDNYYGQGTTTLPQNVVPQGQMGYRFAGWYWDSQFTTPYNYTPFSQNSNEFVLYAKWLKRYEVTAFSVPQTLVFSLPQQKNVKFGTQVFKGLNSWNTIVHVPGMESSITKVTGNQPFSYHFNLYTNIPSTYTEPKYEESTILDLSSGSYQLRSSYSQCGEQGGSTGLHGSIITYVEYEE